MRPLSRSGPLWHRNALHQHYKPPRHAAASRSSRPCYNSSSHAGAPLNLSWPSLSRTYSSSSPPPRAPIFPDAPGSSDDQPQHHHDLASHAAYAARAGLDVTSKTFVGTRYEYVAAAALARLGFAVRRVGGRADRGIDLLGEWRVPSSSSSPRPPLRVLLQCKATAPASASGTGTRVGPHLVRELEGAFAGAPAGWRSTGDVTVLGVLVAQRPATRGVRDALARGRWPMAYVACSATGRLEQMLWNERAARDAGLEGLGAVLQFADADAAPGASNGPQLVLTWHGRPVSVDEPPAEEGS
ncbi:hypothetical protein GGR52DRAFT_133801 [Hypoxylon sp. FL1284]|nr:hypothetical protein GGR52DRAFT_133801 [Hypoxylon sp. FL1284]